MSSAMWKAQLEFGSCSSIDLHGKPKPPIRKKRIRSLLVNGNMI